MKPKSDNLFHFTSSIDVLEIILKNGFRPRFCLEDIRWLGASDEHIAYAMTCFCDIPLSRISEHTSFYGNYGLGMSKEWGLRNGLEPVLYLRPSGKVAKVTDYLMDQYKDSGSEEEKLLHEHAATMVRFSKPISGEMIIGGKSVQKDFYQENEWRYVPLLDSYITKDTFDSEKEAENKKAEAYPLKFAPQDIKYIFVKDDSDIPGLVDFINQQMADSSLNDIKILLTRIISLDTITSDL